MRCECNLPQQVTEEEIKSRIDTALRRRAELAVLDAQGIRVETHGQTVVLRGRVHSWADRSLAKTAAWGAPGVAKVEDELEVVTDDPGSRRGPW